MRRVKIAASARLAFQVLLEQGAEKFGIPVAMEKERIVYDTLNDYIAAHPHRGHFDNDLKLRTYHVSKTPFVLVYDYSETEVRVLFIVHERADRRRLDQATVKW